MNFIKTFLAGLLAVVVGTFLVFFLWIFILLGIAGSMEKSVAVHPESILKIDFSEVLTDAPSSDPLAGLDLMTLQTQRQLPLLKALRALEAARDDDRIKGIYLRMNGTGGVTGSAILEELREALVEFKQSGKFIVAYNETYSQGGYYLASVADKIYMQPEGMMEWAGLSEENRCGNYDLNPACPPESGTVEEMKKHAMKYEKALVLQTMQEYSMDFKKAKVAHNKLTEALAERMKEDGKTDLLLMTAGPYKHNSCMSAYCVDAQRMADAVGMTCWANDDKVRYFSQILFHD